MKLNLKSMINDVLTFGAGSGLAYAANQFGLRQIQHDWLRRGAQLGAAVAGAMFLKNKLGAAFAGAMFYPLMSDLALTMGLVGPADYELGRLAADLDSALAGGNYLGADLSGVDELFIDGVGGYQPLTAW
jgi:hypothetical protein